MANNSPIDSEVLKSFCDELVNLNHINFDDYDKYGVKRGLRNPDGTGVMVGLTDICNVDGYYVTDGERTPKKGRLVFRGVDVSNIVNGCIAENRFGFEEVAWLLIFGKLPTKQQLDKFCDILSQCRELPTDFAEDMIMKAPSNNIMNKIARSVLALYSYDDNPDAVNPENVLRQCIQLLARIPTIMTYAYQVKRRTFYKKSMYLHPIKPEHRTAECILNSIRSDKTFTDEEAKLLDICLMLHAEHGGGNNSTFTVRSTTSTGTDTYSSIAAGVGALKGPRHGGANIKTNEMLDFFKNDVKNITDEGQVADYIRKILKKDAGDRSGLVYGMGHAVYTLSDPRAVILKQKAKEYSQGTDFESDFRLLELIEKLTPEVFAAENKSNKTICANVDFYSGLIYRMLKIPDDLFTPLFVVARVAGWSAHRMEELATSSRIMRPAYKSIATPVDYIPIELR